MKYLEWLYKVSILVCLVTICSIVYDSSRELKQLKSSIDSYTVTQEESEARLKDHISKHFRSRRIIGDSGPDEIGDAPKE